MSQLNRASLGANACISNTYGASTEDGYSLSTFAGSPAPPISLATDFVAMLEGHSGTTSINFAVARTGDTSMAVSANWTVSAGMGGSINGADFVGGGQPSGTVSFAAGATTGTIITDDTGFSIAATSADKPEGHSGLTDYTFTVTRTGATSGVSSVAWAVTGSGATESDFSGGALPSGALNFAAMETGRSSPSRWWATRPSRPVRASRSRSRRQLACRSLSRMPRA